ncbi:Asp23/Gls24 family envelope stress response protein [Pengzhenrongella sp.]|uniref:Asp23/Gls24 family envelope stress response protein n=1 Tax=Pengzhenrongella sp. TaxID=2888820 RepID=UPI002F932557
MTRADLGADRLPCGASVDSLLEQVADGAPPSDPQHQRDCPHCRAAVHELRGLWEPVRALAAAEVAVPPDLVTKVMLQVRALARDGWHTVIAGPLGSTRIATWVVAALARSAAGRVPGVALTLGRAGPVTAPATGALGTGASPTGRRRRDARGVGVAGANVVIILDVVAAYGHDLNLLGDAVRAAVIRHVQALTGLTVLEVNVTMVDVVEGGATAGTPETF